MALLSPNDYGNYWYHVVGANVIPANSKNKVTLVKWAEDTRGNWQEVSIPLEIFEEWKRQDKFKDGIAVICGKIFRGENKDKWLNGIDCDNKLGVEKLCPSGIENIAKITVVEQHANKEKAHIYFYTKEPIKSKVANDGKNGTVPQIEVKSGGKSILYCAGSTHKDGSPIEIIGIDKIKTLDKESLEIQIDDVCREYGIPYLNGTPENLKPVSELIKEDFVLHEGENRSLAILRYLDSKKKYNTEFDEDILYNLGRKFNLAHCRPPYEDSKIRELAKQSKTWMEKKIADEKEIEEEIKISSMQEDSPVSKYAEGLFGNKQWPDVAKKIQEMYHFVTLRETKEMWYYNEKEGVYRPNADTIIEEECQRLVRCCTIKTRNEVKATIKSNRTMIDANELFESSHINTQNGILNPKTFELIPHSHEFLTTTKLPFSVNFNARNLKLWNHILTIIDVKDINLIMELIWVCISWKNPFKKLFVFKGKPNTQKTTLSDIIVWMIGEDNVSREKPQQFLAKDTRFSTSKFIGKRMNTASEIGNLTKDMIENLKSLVGAEKQNTERKNDNTERYFDPTKFVFLFTTNTLGQIYSNIDDNSIITRFQFLIFNNIIEESRANGLWYDDFFENEDDKKTAIETIVNIVIHYQKAQALGKIPKTQWSGVARTKKILKEQMPKEDKYFDDNRLIRNEEGGKISITEIKKDFDAYVKWDEPIKEQALGYLLKAHGFKSSASNGMTYYKGWKLNPLNDQKTLA